MEVAILLAAGREDTSMGMSSALRLERLSHCDTAGMKWPLQYLPGREVTWRINLINTEWPLRAPACNIQKYSDGPTRLLEGKLWHLPETHGVMAR